jgi:GntR family galactonate operon transcriptional repressor
VVVDRSSPLGSSLTGERKKVRTLVDDAVQTVGRAIVWGQYPPDTALPVEAEIAAELGVGRNVVREAIKILSAKSLVLAGRGTGMVVLPRGEWNYLDPDVIQWNLDHPELRDELIDELSALRAIIEPQVAALAATAASTVEVLRLFEAYEAMENAPDKFAGIEADILFHRRLFEACHNKMMLSLMRTVFVVLRANFALAIEVDAVSSRYPDDHKLVAEAIHQRDPERARAIMTKLLHKNIENVAKMRRARSLLGGQTP